MPADAELAPWADGVPHWDELDPTARRVAARLWRRTPASPSTPTTTSAARRRARRTRACSTTRWCSTCSATTARRARAGLEGTIREHLRRARLRRRRRRHGRRARRASAARRPTPSTRSGWALAMNTPYQWTKQVASHFGGTRDGLVVHWPAGIAARGEVRHQFHHVIDVLPTILDAAGLPPPETVNGVAQQPVRGHVDALLLRRRRRGRPPPHSVLRDGRQPRHLPRGLDRRHPARHAVAHGRRRRPSFEDDVWELYDTSQRLEPGPRPRRRRSRDGSPRCSRSSSTSRPRGTRCFPLDDRVTERENPQLAGRLDLHHGRTSVLRSSHRPAHRGGCAERQEPLATRSTVQIAMRERAFGRSARRAGRAVRRLVPVLHTALLATRTTATGPHHHRGHARCGRVTTSWSMDLGYDGGRLVLARRSRCWSTARSSPAAASSRPRRSTSASTRRSTWASTAAPPVTDDYPPVHNAFTGTVHAVRVELGDPGDEEGSSEHGGLYRRVMAAQ